MWMIWGALLAMAAEPSWIHLSSVRAELPVPAGSNQQTGVLVADLDGNGAQDFVISFRVKGPALVWYRMVRGKWEQQVIEPEFLTVEAGGAAHDIDGDGDLDIVFGADSQNRQLWWWENPSPRFEPRAAWRRHVIKDGGANQHHDQVFADFLGAGKAQLVFWNQRAKALFLAEIPQDVRSVARWPMEMIFQGRAGEGSASYAEGIDAFDVDGDGRKDLLAGNYWFKVEEGRFRPVKIGEYGGRIRGGRFKKGRVGQVVIAPGDGSGPLVLYSCDGNPEDSACWKRRDLLGQSLTHGHTLDVGDVDGDGNLDVFTGEMAKWTRGDAVDHPQAKSWILYGDGKGGFRPTVFTTGHGWHEGRLADLDGDGDLDVLGKPYTWTAPRVDIWLNQRKRR